MDISANADSSKLNLVFLQPSTDVGLEEVVLRVQGYLVDSKLPPLRKMESVIVVRCYTNAYLCLHSIPSNQSAIIGLKQQVTISGLGVEGFDAAVKGALVIYQAFQSRVSALKGQLRDWAPMAGEGDITLTFGNRYLTREKERGGDQLADISQVVDPFNVLRPRLRLEHHTTDNVVEYWERQTVDSKWV